MSRSRPHRILRNRLPHRRLLLEQLEDRRLLAVTYSRVIEIGDPIPDSNIQFGGISIDGSLDDGQIAFIGHGRFRQGGVFVSNGPGAAGAIASHLSTLPDGTRPYNGWLEVSNDARVNPAGATVQDVAFIEADEYLGTGTTSNVFFARSGSPLELISGPGDVANPIQTSVEDGSVAIMSASGVFLRTNSAPVKVADTGDTVPEAFSEFRSVQNLGGGNVAFIAQTNVGIGVFVSSGGQVSKLVGVGDPISDDVTVTAVANTFTGFGTPGFSNDRVPVLGSDGSLYLHNGQQATLVLDGETVLQGAGQQLKDVTVMIDDHDDGHVLFSVLDNTDTRQQLYVAGGNQVELIASVGQTIAQFSTQPIDSIFGIPELDGLEVLVDLNFQFPPIKSGKFKATFDPLINYTFGEIHGYKFNDRDRDATDTGTATDPRVPGVKIILSIDSDENGSPDDMRMTTTDAMGRYKFDRLMPGRYQVFEEVPEGAEQTTEDTGPLVIRSGDIYEATAMMAPGTPGTQQTRTTITELAFGNFYLGEIHGYKFDDTNGDGDLDSGEPRYAGITIELHIDEDRNGEFERVVTTLTDPTTGEYHFRNLFRGNYSVRERLPIDTEPTTQNPPPIDLKSGEIWQAFAGQVDLIDRPQTLPKIQPGLILGNFTQVEISGTKFADHNGNGQRDLGDGGLRSWPIFLDLDSNGTIDVTTETDANGHYKFVNVGPGTHSITEESFADYEQTFPDAAALGRHSVTTESGVDIRGLDFGNRPLVSFVAGTKFYDLNNDGVRNDTPLLEPGLPFWTIYIDANNDGVLNNNDPANNNVCDINVLEPCQLTDEFGNYLFVVDPGDYIIREVVPDRWTQTFPGDPFVHGATIDFFGQGIAGLDFGNFNEPPVGNLINPPPGETTDVDLGYVDVRWIDPLPTELAIDPASIDTSDILIESAGALLSIDRVEPQGGNVYRYFYDEDDDALRNGDVIVTLVGGQVFDTQGVANTLQTESFTYEGQPQAAGALDVTGSGDPNPFRDGILLVRYMLGQPDANLEDPSLIPSGATRTTGAAIRAHLDAAGTVLDINGDGTVNPFQDGILIVRYLLGQPDANLEDPLLISAGSTRTTGAAIRAYLDGLLPQAVAGEPIAAPRFSRTNGEGEFATSRDVIDAKLVEVQDRALLHTDWNIPAKVLRRDVDPELTAGKASSESDSDSDASQWDLALQELLPLTVNK